MSEFQRTEIDLRTLHGVQRHAAFRCGHFAVHQMLQSNGLYGMEWCITHVPSGIGFARYFPNRQCAENAASAIAALRSDWATFNPSTVSKQFLSDLKRIYTEQQGEPHPHPDNLTRERGQKEYRPDLNGYGGHSSSALAGTQNNPDETHPTSAEATAGKP